MNTQELSMFTETIRYQDEVIFIQPVCDFFGIDYKNQLKSISRNPLVKKSVSKKRSISLFGDNFERIALTKQGFITWILQINPSIVHQNLKEKLFLYQTLIFDYLFGTAQRERAAQTQYMRLKKLKALRAKINAEISRCEAEVHGYLHDRLIQYRLELE